jgi:dihydrofolate synthase/folylpolyglutamate synthase
VVAITPIAMDHEEYLGHTVEEIAAEKAAIIRRGVTAIIAPQEQRILEVINRRCRAVGVEPHSVDSTSVADATVGLPGRHQIVNAATATVLAQALRQHGMAISDSAILEGLRNAQHAGRLELWNTTPPILFDGAHNPASAQALRNYLDEFASQPITMIFGAMRDKPLDQLAEILFPKANQLVLTQIESPRAASLEDLKRVVRLHLDESCIHEASSPEEAWRIALEVTPTDGLILVTGSLYLIGQMQKASTRYGARASLPA